MKNLPKPTSPEILQNIEKLINPAPAEEQSKEPEPQEPETPEKPENEKPPKKKSALDALIKLLIKLSVIAFLIWLALIFVFGVFRLEGNNMYPMLKDGDLCITYKLEEYHSTDVVAYRVGNEIQFGRIIARAGDKVDGDTIGLLINGGRPSEEIFYPTQMWDINLNLPVTLNEGEFVILNDYREDLRDSRSYGIIHEDDLEGKIVFIFRRRGF